jgi:hypothetical protein
VGGPFRNTTAWAARLIRELQAPAGVKLMVLVDAYDLGHTVVQACREQHVHCAATLQSTRSRCTPGWQLKAGRSGRHRCRRRRTATLVLGKPPGEVRGRDLDAGWRHVRQLGGLPVVFARQGAARKSLGLVTDDPEGSAAGLLRAYDRRWASAQGLQDRTPLLGRGPYQHRPYRAAVIHRPRVGFAYALRTPRRIAHRGAQGQPTRTKAVHLSTATAQDQLRGLLWEDLVASLKEHSHEKSVLAELERLRVA